MLTEVEAATALKELSASGPVTEGAAARLLRALADSSSRPPRRPSTVRTPADAATDVVGRAR